MHPWSATSLDSPTQDLDGASSSEAKARSREVGRGMWRVQSPIEEKEPNDTRSKKLLETKGIATNGAIGRYERGSWPYYERSVRTLLGST